MVDTVPELQYALELSVYGLVEKEDLKSSLPLDIGTRRELLSKYWSARCRNNYKWHPLPQLIAAWFHSLFHAVGSPDLYSGNVLMVHEGPHNTPLLHHSLRCLALVRQEVEADDNLKVEVIQWSRDLDPFVAFGVDPGQDLLVVVRRCFVSTGTVNLDVTFCPLSQPATLFQETSVQVAVSTGNSSRSIHVLIYGSTVALVLGSAAAVDAFADMEVIFISSKSHTVIGRFYHPSTMIPDSRGHNFADIALLDDTSFFVLCAHDTHHTLNLYIFAPHNERVDGSPFTNVANFHLPSYAPDTICVVQDLYCTTSFQSTYRPTPEQLQDLDPESHYPLDSFVHSSSNSLVHLSLLYSPVPPADSHVHAESMDICHVIYPAVFREAINTYRSGCQKTRSVPWAEWGPQNSRSIRMRSSVQNEFASHGSRVMVSDGLARTRHILDFNTLPYALHQHRGETLPTGIRLMFPGLNIDAFASVASGRNVEAIKEIINGSLDAEFSGVDLSGVVNVDAQASVLSSKVEEKYTYACFCGVEPPTAVSEKTRAIYIATPSTPLHSSFHFEKLGPSGIVVLQEVEARALLKEFNSDAPSDSLTGRELVRALVSQPALDHIRGIVVVYGNQALDGCVASIKIDEIVDDFDKDEEEEDWEREERYEFDIPKPIIGADDKTIPEGAYAAFIGKLIASIYIEGGNLSQAKYTANQFSFQLEQSCVAAASTALTPGKSPWDLSSRIPRMKRLSDNLTRYIHSLHMLRGDEKAPPVERTRPPPRPEIYWRAPEPSVPASASTPFDSEDEAELSDLLPETVSADNKSQATKSPSTKTGPSTAKSGGESIAGFKRGFLKGMF
ncbi:hypothetical protein EIP86_011178 [Pleurotus ostreatoroseus]|nr:hypothetical protein EIP86_011178 [Pleurotus ostreatoroseus]